MAHAGVIVAGIGFGSQSGPSFTSGSSSAHTLGDFQGGEAVGRQDSSSGGALNAGSAQPAASNVGDGGRGRERSRWDRDRDQIPNIQEKPREASSHEDSKQGHRPDGYVQKSLMRVACCILCANSVHSSQSNLQTSIANVYCNVCMHSL